MAPILVASCMMAVCPKLGASLRRVLTLIIVSKTIDWKWVFTSFTTCFDILVRESNIVSKMPSMSSSALNYLYCVEQFAETFECEVLALDGNYDGVGCCECIDGYQT